MLSLIQTKTDGYGIDTEVFVDYYMPQLLDGFVFLK